MVDIETGETLGEGKEGEVCVRGPTVMKGLTHFTPWPINIITLRVI